MSKHLKPYLAIWSLPNATVLCRLQVASKFMPVSSLIIGECHFVILNSQFKNLSVIQWMTANSVETLFFTRRSLFTVTLSCVEDGNNSFLQVSTWCPSNRSPMLWPCRKTSLRRNVDRWGWNSSNTAHWLGLSGELFSRFLVACDERESKSAIGDKLCW